MSRFCLMLISLVLLSGIVSASGAYYYVGLRYDRASGNFSLEDLDLMEGEDVQVPGMATHAVSLRSFSDEELYGTSVFFRPMPYEYVPMGDNPKAPDRPAYDTFSFAVPYSGHGKEIVMTDLFSRESFRIDVSMFASCNSDGICDINEDARYCPEDCDAEKAIEAERAKEAPKGASAGEQPQGVTYRGYIIIAALILASIAVLFLALRRKR